MNIEPAQPAAKASAEQFIGDVWVDHIATPNEGDQRMSVAIVKFAPGARTAWHCHARGQYLRVTQGVARFGTRDGQIIEVRPGQTLYTPPGQDHFHASADGTFMEHIAMLESGDDPATTTVWKEQVTDAEFNGTEPA